MHTPHTRLSEYLRAARFYVDHGRPAPAPPELHVIEGHIQHNRLIAVTRDGFITVDPEVWYTLERKRPDLIGEGRVVCLMTTDYETPYGIEVRA